jgi:hypothetical protein
MKSEQKEIVKILSDELTKTSLAYLSKMYKDIEENISGDDIINFIISAHISFMINNMLFIVDNLYEKKGIETIIKFKNDLLDALSKMPIIDKVEEKNRGNSND